MTPLERAAVAALTGALRDVQQLDDSDRCASLMYAIRDAPGVGDFVVDPDRRPDLYLGRIARACVEHSNAPAARWGLHDGVRYLAAGHRAVAWLSFFNEVLDSRCPEDLKLDLLRTGTRLRKEGLHSIQSPGQQDPLGDFTRLVSGGTPEKVRAFLAGINDVSNDDDSRSLERAPSAQPPVSEGSLRRLIRLYPRTVGVCVLLLGLVIWAVIEALGDRPTVSVSVGWDTTVLQPNSTASATVAVPGGRTRLVLPLDLRDLDPGSGACPGTVDLSIDGQKPTTRGLSDEVHTGLPGGRSRLTLKLTLKAPQGCKFQINTKKVRFED
ncbi:hypothetical protein [Streptomyces sp. NPDC001404]|uniref:hypothetical protein n=1 Tax=Streptomyces sp. NPDC001404 TaxID=3364571 RepID=UPI0036A938EB